MSHCHGEVLLTDPQRIRASRSSRHEREGISYLAAFERVGAEMLQPSCGACAGCGPGSSISETQVTVSAINRNFPGRSGPGKVWLASPAP